MISKKVISCIGVVLLVVQSPLGVLASDMPVSTTLESAFTQGFIKGFNNPEEVIQESLGELEPTPRELFHINRITSQLEIIINKAGTNEEKIQKAINVNVYLLDTLVANSKGLIENTVAAQGDIDALAAVEKEAVLNHFQSKVKIIVGSIIKISEIYLLPQIEEYMSFVDDFQDEANQKDINTIVGKIAGLVNMVDSAFENYAPNINELMRKHVGISTKEFFHHGRIVAFFTLQMILDEENKDLNPADVYDAKDIVMIDTAIGYLKQSLKNADEKTKAAYIVYDAFIANGGTLKMYWDGWKLSLNSEFVEVIDSIVRLVIGEEAYMNY